MGNVPQSYVNRILPQCGLLKGHMQVRMYLLENQESTILMSKMLNVCTVAFNLQSASPQTALLLT